MLRRALQLRERCQRGARLLRLFVVDFQQHGLIRLHNERSVSNAHAVCHFLLFIDATATVLLKPKTSFYAAVVLHYAETHDCSDGKSAPMAVFRGFSGDR